MPEPTAFLSRNLPACSIIRPTATRPARPWELLPAHRGRAFHRPVACLLSFHARVGNAGRQRQARVLVFCGATPGALGFEPGAQRPTFSTSTFRQTARGHRVRRTFSTYASVVDFRGRAAGVRAKETSRIRQRNRRRHSRFQICDEGIRTTFRENHAAAMLVAGSRTLRLNLCYPNLCSRVRIHSEVLNVRRLAFALVLVPDRDCRHGAACRRRFCKTLCGKGSVGAAKASRG